MTNYRALFFIASFFLYLLFPIGLISVNSYFYKTVFTFHFVSLLASALLVTIKVFKLNTKNYIFYLVFTLLLSFIVTMNLLPITARDALLYHLAVPKWWIASGYITEISWHEWSHFPLIGSLAYTGLIQFGLVKLSGIYHFLYLVLALGFLSLWFNKLTNKSSLSQFLFVFSLSIPINLRLAYSPMADFILLCFFILAFIEIYNLIFKETHCHKTLFFSFFFITATKYSALVVVACLISSYFITQIYNSKNFLKAFKTSFFLGVGALLGVLPWLVKNYTYTKNPFFPFLKSFFGEGDNVAFLGKINPVTYRMEVYGESLLDIILIPVNFFIKGADNNPMYFDGVLTPVLILSVLSIFYKKHRGLVLLSCLFIIQYLLLSLNVFYALVRYQLPSVLLISILLFIFIDSFSDKRNRQIVFALTIIIFGFHGFHVFNYAKEKVLRKPVIAYLKGKIDEDKYLEERIGEYHLISYINKELSVEDKVYLVLTGNKFYLYDKPVESEYFSANVIVRHLKEEKSLTKYFKSNNFSHILLNIPRLKKLLESSLDESQLSAWASFFNNHLKHLKSKGSYALLKLT